MTWLTRLAIAALACLTAACGGSPTAPTAIMVSTDPVAVADTEASAPVSQTLTGTWFLGTQNFMTLTQDGLWITGMERPTSTIDGGVQTTTRVTISGTVCGDAVTLQRSVAVFITVNDRQMSCNGEGTFTGTISGNTLSGIYTARMTPLNCSAEPPIALTTIEGPATFTRQ